MTSPFFNSNELSLAITNFFNLLISIEKFRVFFSVLIISIVSLFISPCFIFICIMSLSIKNLDVLGVGPPPPPPPPEEVLLFGGIGQSQSILQLLQSSF